MENHFEEYLSKNLNPEVFMPLRGKYYANIFYKHKIHDKIKNSIITNSLTLIVGNPLSGKSRITYDTLKKMTSYKVLKANKRISEFQQYQFDEDLKNVVVVFDDIDEFFGTHKKNEVLNSLLIEIINKEVKCIINCRKGPELKKFRKYADKHILNEFIEDKNYFIIPKFSLKYIPFKNFYNANKKDFINDIKEYDGNIGSLFMPLSDMRRRFEKLQLDNEELPLAILLGLKLHFHLLNYEDSKRNYDILNIQYFCKKYLSLEKISNYDWDKAINILIDSRTDLNFIEVKETIIVEIAYLDIFEFKEDVVFDDYNKKRLYKLLDSLYNYIDKEVCKFPLKTRDLNEKIKIAESYEDGLSIFQNIENPDEHSITSLMSLTDDKNKLIELYELMRSDNQMNEFFIPHNIVISNFKNFKDLLYVLKKVNSTQLTSKNETINKLIKLAQHNKKESLKILFESFDNNFIYSSPGLNDLVLRCVMDKEDYDNYIEPIIGEINNIGRQGKDNTGLKENIIRSCIKTKQYGKSIDLVKQHLKGYSYFNELGNCYQESDFRKSIKYYQKSLELDIELKDRLKSHININRVIYDNSEQMEYYFLIENAHLFYKSNYKELASNKKYRNLKYLGKYIVLNEIEKLERDERLKKLKFLFSRFYITKSVFQEVQSFLTKDEIKEITIANNV